MGAIVVALALAAAACGSADSELAAADGTTLDPSVLTGEATTHTGETFDLSTVADKDLVVWFWAPW